jgi:hypothetical protein
MAWIPQKAIQITVTSGMIRGGETPFQVLLPGKYTSNPIGDNSFTPR